MLLELEKSIAYLVFWAAILLLIFGWNLHETCCSNKNWWDLDKDCMFLFVSLCLLLCLPVYLYIPMHVCIYLEIASLLIFDDLHPCPTLLIELRVSVTFINFDQQHFNFGQRKLFTNLHCLCTCQIYRCFCRN